MGPVAFRMSAELLFQRDLFRGYPLEGSDYVVRMAENIFPLYNRIHRLAVQPATGDEAARQRWIWSVLGFAGVPVRGLTDKDAQSVQQFEFPYRKQRVVEANSSPAELRLAEMEKTLRSERSQASAAEVRQLVLQLAQEGFKG